MRIRTLDSVRGVAALVVLFEHCYLTFPATSRRARIPRHLSGWAAPWPWLRYSPLHLLVAGSAAVMVFFVLSGFVLALPFVEGTQPSYGRYLLKRFCRIWLPFALAILASALLYEVIAPTPIAGLSDWFNQGSWSRPVDGHAIALHLMMTGRAQDRVLDNAMWSLVHELRISVIFPVLVVLVRWGPVRALAAALALNLACEAALLYLPEDSVLGTLLATGEFVIAFVCGIALTLHLATWRSTLKSLSPRGRALLWLLAFAALAFPASVPDLARPLWILGAVLLLAQCLTSPLAERLLSISALHWLGRVSYSLYLTHLLILLSAVHLLYGRVPLPTIMAGIVVTSLACAEIMHRCVEKPAIALGRRLAFAPMMKRPATTGP